MKILLTRDQEATLWNFAQTLMTDKGDKYMYFPYWLKPTDISGEYERLRFDQIPEEIKDKLLIAQGVKLPSE
jgi:hypothetical protein